MYFEEIVLWHFRNYEKAVISFSPEVNLIRGENAQGKTNLLEALYFLCTGRSFRCTHLTDLIPYGNAFFHLEGHFVKDSVSQVLKASFDGQVRKLTHNETLRSSFSSLLGLLPIVLLSPQDLALVIGGPADRRRFLDLQIAQENPLYIYHLGRFLKAVKQRNLLLKNRKEESLSAWEKTLAISAAYIMEKRKEALENLLPRAQNILKQLTEGEDHLDIFYISTFPEKCRTPETIFEELQKTRKRELFYKMTLAGPHRDDLLIHLNGKLAKNFASEGQKRSIVTALRLAEWQKLKHSTGYTPLLGIDDFGIHLDAKRYALIQKCVHGLGQVFLTTPNITQSDAHRIIEIHSGKILA
jgi:DNA replication and repair protein RecF